MRHKKGSKLVRLLWDFSGAFGDIGVLFPLAIALIAQNHFNPSTLFLMAGLFYISSAWYFRITMPVQPLKAMSAIAIGMGMGHEIVNAAGITMGLILIVLAVTGMSIRLGNIFPVSVVRGIQLGLGMMLISTSVKFMSSDPGVTIFSALVLIITLSVLRGIPPLIPLLIISVLMVSRHLGDIGFGFIAPEPSLPSSDDLWQGLTLLVLPQIALTFGNAIVATEATAKILYGERAKRLNFKNIPLSMGIANIISGIMGGAPMCHGSGGLTAHNKFGATTERSGYIIGFTLIVMALVFGESILEIVSAFPEGILGVLICYVGIQHSLFIRDIITERSSVFIALTVATAGFFTHNLTIGFALGLGLYYLNQLFVRIKTILSR